MTHVSAEEYNADDDDDDQENDGDNDTNGNTNRHLGRFIMKMTLKIGHSQEKEFLKEWKIFFYLVLVRAHEYRIDFFGRCRVEGCAEITPSPSGPGANLEPIFSSFDQISYLYAFFLCEDSVGGVRLLVPDVVFDFVQIDVQQGIRRRKPG